uniref:Myb-like domain-containing protein n=1 Tax=Panagrolaimus superbus TaxID=310955 RepID=A0A914Z1S3_9BILA
MFSTTSTISAIKRKKRAFEKDEELDATRFTMADLIDWRPKTENTLRSKWKEAEKKFKEEGFAVKREKKEEAVETEIGPKVKMDEEGNVIIDEESLVVRRNPENSVLETVDDDLIPKKLNSLSFKRNYSRTTNWSEIETALFYEVLSSTGTDFSLMQEYLPFKTRTDIKKKFNKEEKVNLARINTTLSKPSILNDDIIKGRIEKYVELIDRQKEEKLAAKLKKKKKKPTEQQQANSDAEVVEESTSQQKSEAADPDLQETPEPKKK